MNVKFFKYANPLKALYRHFKHLNAFSFFRIFSLN